MFLVDDAPEESHSGAPAAFYWIAGRLLLFAVIGIVSVALQLSRGELNLYGFFAAYTLVNGCRFLQRRRGAHEATLGLYRFIVFADFFLIVVLAVVLLVGTFAIPNVQLRVADSGVVAFLAFLTLPADWIFSRWAVRSLESERMRQFMSPADSQSEFRGGTRSQFGVAAMLMWTTVFAGGISAYLGDVRDRPFTRDESSSRYTSNGIDVRVTTKSRRGLFGSKPKRQVFVHVVIFDQNTGRSVGRARSANFGQAASSGQSASTWTSSQSRTGFGETRKFQVDGQPISIPLNHNIAFYRDGALESSEAVFTESLLEDYIQESSRREAPPDLSGFEAYLAKAAGS